MKKKVPAKKKSLAKAPKKRVASKNTSSGKQQEAEARKAHDLYWKSYITGDVQTLTSLLGNDYTQVGSVENEVFFSKKDAVKFVETTIDQVNGNVDLRNRVTKSEWVGEFILVSEQCDLYVLGDGEWTFYSKFRASSLMNQTGNGWKLIHQHSSVPDFKAQDGESIAIEKITVENLQLRDAIKRRTVELEHKSRELEIESSLERVRTVAMGMRKPDDMLDVCQTIAQQLELLKVKEIRNVQTAIIYESKRTYLNYEYYVKHNKLLTTEVDYSLHPEHATFVNKMLESPEAFYTQGFTGKELKDWYAYQKTTPQFADSYLEQATSLNYYMYSIGGVVLGMSTYSPLREEEITLFKRFRNVFDLAYKRFEDIKKAEAQAREAQIQLALERARSQSMLMQHSKELDDTLRVFHEQVQLLGISSAFSFLWLPDEEKSNHIFWAAWEEKRNDSAAFKSKAISYPLDRNEPATAQCLVDWRSDEPVHSYAVKPAEVDNYFAAWAELLDGVEKLKPEFFRDGLYYVEAFMKYGCFGVMVENDLSDEEKNILYRFSVEFERTYTRFLDLQRAEAQALRAEHDLLEIKSARKKAEDALTELQATQKQLIQSEKMASLGELTAGIAHEIQNPLNFVNNFSEVSTELVDEMNAELAAGNWQPATEIARDIKQNLEKINHHGKRAGDIVKGMLQHSRTGSGQKGLTDINVLCDEYLRLAYHGLKAKDKSFNADFKTDFDASLEKVNVVPQDIGRVVLNLITNAFYAVNERLKTCQAEPVEAGYEPQVVVSTKKLNNKIVISVSDNGNGIPDSIKEKIFQPFFTTKPTGQGTGLGLSLSYDIVKAHGGELKVETKKGEGSEFIVQLPFKSIG